MGIKSVNGIVGDDLEIIIQRIERREEEKAGIAADIKEIYAEARGRGFDPKTIRAIIQLRKLSQQEREEQEARGNILPLDDYHLFATEVIQEARDSLLRIPRLMKPHLCRKCQTKAAELETLIQSVESNRLPLEETLNAYQRGQQLIGRCSTLLRDAEQRLQQFDGQSLTDITLVDRP